MHTRGPKNISSGRFRKAAPISIKGAYFRSVSLKHEKEILNTQGSLEHGGRYNPSGEFGALYAGENKAVCKAELARTAKDNTAARQIIAKLRVSLVKVLDLTNTTNLKKLGIQKNDLIQEEKKGGWSLTWGIARFAYRSGYQAIIAPSATGKGNNLIIFGRSIDTATVKVISKPHI